LYFCSFLWLAFFPSAFFSLLYFVRPLYFAVSAKMVSTTGTAKKVLQADKNKKFHKFINRASKSQNENKKASSRVITRFTPNPSLSLSLSPLVGCRFYYAFLATN